MSGNCATGIAVIAISPASVMTIETTKASRGRSMKTSEIIGRSYWLAPRRRAPSATPRRRAAGRRRRAVGWRRGRRLARRGG